MRSGTLVLVDGWNHYLAAFRCFGYEPARTFPVDRLATHVVSTVGSAPVSEVSVVMALPDRNRSGEEPEFWAWRKKLMKLKNFGVNHHKARFSYLGHDCASCAAPLDQYANCGKCGTENRLFGRRQEKGADVQLATLALNGAHAGDYSTLVVFSQDTDFSPMVRAVKDVYQRQGQPYEIYSVFPDCGSNEHKHRGIPGARELRISADTYAELAGRPFGNPVGVAASR